MSSSATGASRADPAQSDLLETLLAVVSRYPTVLLCYRTVKLIYGVLFSRIDALCINSSSRALTRICIMQCCDRQFLVSANHSSCYASNLIEHLFRE